MSKCGVLLSENCGKQLIKLNEHLSQLRRAGKYFESLQLFHQIYSSHQLKPDHYTFSAAIISCGNLGDTTTGAQLHSQAIRSGLQFFPHVANTLLSYFAKLRDLDSVKRVFSEIPNPDDYSCTTLLSACTKLGDVEYAWKMFDQMPKRSLAVWNAMITGHGEDGYDKVALDLFWKMHFLGVRHDNYSLASVLSLCSLELLDFGVQVHSLIIKTGFLGPTVHDQISYNVMIAGLASMERDEYALQMFRNMHNVGLKPTESSFVSIMSSCYCARFAVQVHALAVKLMQFSGI